jgi:hypothetical protein
MESQRTKREWLQWLARVRLMMIVLVLVMGLVWPQYSTGQSASRLFLSIAFFWLTLALLAYVGVVFAIAVPWREVLLGIVWPRVAMSARSSSRARYPSIVCRL